MKRLMGIVSVIVMCLAASGCSNEIEKKTSNEDNAVLSEADEYNPKADISGTEENTILSGFDESDPDIDISEIEQIYINEYAEQKDNAKCVPQIIKKLGEKGYIAVDSENKIDMTNMEEMLSFVKTGESGGSAEASVLRVSYLGGFTLYRLKTDAGKVVVERIYYSFENNKLNETLRSDFEADYFDFTEEGYLLIEGSWHSPVQYALTMREQYEHIALRVFPLDGKCRDLCEKYITPVSYGLNNMFITNWNEEDFDNLDFYDIFEKFYPEMYNKEFPYLMNENLSIGNEYAIPADELESVIKLHFRLSDEKLRSLLRYNADTDSYNFRPRGFYEFDYAEIPYPEVQAYEENADGSVTLFVNAVYPNGNTSKLFTHKVTVKDEDGKIYYLSNEIDDIDESDLWWHADRFTDNEWNEYYKD